ncbi:MAG: transglutaminase-like domain-containing protein [Prevotellaceae bacterium]|jgi:regulator of sirC expression with transglutaminase-like and TPR domain|nr:transglutaminase-like domain-containing protein [Prevotellaceae bacterium]
MTTDKLSALINLLDDPDREVYDAVSVQLLSRGEGIISELEDAWEQSPNELVQHRIEDILQRIQLDIAYKGLKRWIENGAEDVLQGAYWVARHQYPELNFNELERKIDKIKTNIWLEINDSLTALEKIKIVNHFIYDIYNYGSEQNFMQPSYCFINHVLDSHKGNPISLAIIYLAVCQRLELPVYGLCIPRNFLAAYNDALLSRVLFHINPFFRGTPLSQNDIELYFKQMKIKPKDEYFQPCSNKVTILRLIETLIYIYEQESNAGKIAIYKQLIPLFDNEQTYFMEDDEYGDE